MFVQVRLLKGYTELLWYEVPSELDIVIHKGAIVKVPFRTNTLHAMVEAITLERPIVSFGLKSIIGIVEHAGFTQTYQLFIEALSRYYALEPLFFIKRLHAFINKNPSENALPMSQTQAINESVVLTDAQKKCVTTVLNSMQEKKYKPFLLHGVTGSGKTEVYIALIKKAYEENKSALFLLPEVTLAVRFVQILKERLPHIPLFGFHSAAGTMEKKQVFEYIDQQKPLVIVGVHLPIFLPVYNLGIIIIDEEHETGFQEKKHPKINSKDAALIRAAYYNIPIILGSATPSVTSLYQVTQKKWELLRLEDRYNGSFPKVEIVSLKDGKERKHFWFSDTLITAIKERLRLKEQTILFLNRRGHSFFIQCRACAYVFSCTNCSVSLTLHDNNILCCHYCSFSKQVPSLCDACKASEKFFIKKGLGTQQLMHILKSIFPKACIERADLDVTVNKKKWSSIVERMLANEIDILVGTQTVTKGYHFPSVTLVGVMWADLDFNMPIYNATESALQQLIQVAGRAGRTRDNGLVIIQTMAENTLFNYVSEKEYLSFCQEELATRKMLLYPPFSRFAEIELRSNDEAYLDQSAVVIKMRLQELIAMHNLSVIALGPAKPPIYKIKNTYAQKIYLKGSDIRQLTFLYKQLADAYYGEKMGLFFTPNPQAV